MKLFKENITPRLSTLGDKIYPLVVDIKKGVKSGDTVNFVTADNEVGILSIELVNGDEPYDISGCIVCGTIQRPDTSTLNVYCDIVGANKLEIPLGVSGTYQEGIHNFDLKIYRGNEKVIGVPTMSYTVTGSLSSDGVVEGDDRLPVLTMVLDNAQDKLTRLDKAIAGATNDLEVKEARDGEVTLNARLERDFANTNRELEKIKKLEESTVSTITTDSSFTTVSETNQGYFEDVRVEGKTLVNLAKPVSYFASASGWNYIKFSSEFFKAQSTYTILAYNMPNGFNCRVAETSIEDTRLTFTTTDVLKDLTLYILNKDREPLTAQQLKDTQILILEGDHTDKDITFFEGLKSVGQDVDEISVSSTNSDNTETNKKQILYYNPTTQTWEKPVLREWDSIEKHSDGKYYYHKRSEEVVLNGSGAWRLPVGERWNNKTLTCSFILKINGAKGCTWGKYTPRELSSKFSNYGDIELYNSDIEGFTTDNEQGDRVFRVLRTKLSTQDVAGFKQWLQANPVTVVYQLAKEEVYECANLDLITYNGETNLIVSSGAIQPKITLKVLSNVSNVVKLLQEKVSVLENKFIKGLQQVLAGDMMSLAHLLYPEDFEDNHEIQTLEL